LLSLEQDKLKGFLKALLVTMLIIIPIITLIAYLNMVVRLGMPFTFNVLIGPIVIGTLISFVISVLNLNYYLRLAHIEKEKMHELEELVIEQTQELKEASDRLKKLSVTDSLTGLTNRRGYEESMKKEMALSKRSCHELSLMMIDIDLFKLYNDNYGHDQGDIALKTVAETIKDSLPRASDFVARFGGEEFVVLLPVTDAQGALVIAKKIIDNVEAKDIRHKYSKVSGCVTVSIGIAAMNGENIDKNVLFKRADTALYKSKINGRNQAHVFQHTE